MLAPQLCVVDMHRTREGVVVVGLIRYVLAVVVPKMPEPTLPAPHSNSAFEPLAPPVAVKITEVPLQIVAAEAIRLVEKGGGLQLNSPGAPVASVNDSGV